MIGGAGVIEGNPGALEPLEAQRHRRARLHRRSAIPLRTRLAAARGAWRSSAAPLGLLAVLVAQAVCSARLIDSNGAFADEALYIWAGHLQIAHWLHGTPVPAFATYFSGAPVIYPPIAAVFDRLGGLAAVRALSLVIMLGTTALCYATAQRLAGRRAAFFAAAAFAALGVSMRLGAFATYDALALFLLAGATYMAVRAGEGQIASGWLAGAASLLALADATKYAAALFDPVVVLVVLLVAARDRPWRAALGRAATHALYTLSALGLLVALGGSEYVQGISQTTLARADATAPPMAALSQSWHLIGWLGVLALLGALACLASRIPLAGCVLLAVLAGAALLVPVEQARIHTLTSLDKHVDFGAFFAAVPAGYLADWLVTRARRATVQGAATAVLAGALFLPWQVGVGQARALFHSWPNPAPLVAAVKGALAERSGPILAEHPQTLSYYLPAGRAWYRWSSTFTIRLPHGRSRSAGVGTPLGESAYARLLRRGYYALVELDFGSSAAMDDRLAALLARDPHYRLAARLDYGPRGARVWVRRSPAPVTTAELAPEVAGESALGALLTPLSHPSGVLGPVVASVEVTAALTLLATLAVRFGWRRRKAVGEL